MEQLKFERKPIRSSVTRTINLIESELTKETPDRHTLRCQLEKLEVLLTRINEVDIKILSSMRADGCSEKEYEEESLSIEEYEDKIRNTKVKAEEMFVPSFQLPGGSQSPTNSAAWYDSVGTSLNGESKRRNFKLPKIQLRKFNGDMKDWLSWWSQFKKIHEDDTLADSDKFDYLVQGMVIGSRARDVVDVYPHTEENYPKAIAALQERFGQPKLLKQLYVRELLKMVIQNAKSKEDFQLCKMYDKLESHLKALESLNVSHEQMADFLYPMVESSLPEDLLVAWQRSLFYGHDGSQSNPPQSELDFLLKFLKKEVENEGQRSLAKSGFETDEKKKEAVKQKKTFSRFPKPEYESDYPTGAGLFSGHSTSQCVFCKKSGHQSSVCHKAGNMTLNEKKEVVKKNKLCLVCLKPGHFARDCTCQWNCVACEVKHCKAMCPLRSVVDKSSELEASSSATRTSAANFNVACRGDVLLKTLVVKACGPKAVTSVRLIYDEGSQLSNCGAATISLIGSKCIGHEWGRNVLFGGGVTDVKKINKYAVDLKSLDGHVKKTLVLREAAKICGSIPRVPAGPWIQALRKKNIWLSDYQDSYVDNPEIEVLIDYWGQLVTGKQVKLRCGLIAVETIFGWTLSGPVPNINTNDTVAMSCISLFHGEASVQCLWNLDSIGIKDPEEHKSKRENEEETKRHFLSTVSRNKEGRYTVTLPWIDGAQKIPDNKLVAEKRLIGTTAKLKANGNYKFYDQIFVDWEKEGIIEAVSEEDNSTLCHYLPHRAVIKEESLTTPVRPVFDASCKVGRNPSLNDCLEKGPNLLELIPSLLLRFRERKLGVISDVRKAFQMIEVAEADRDFLRFLCPFLLGAVIELHLESVKEELRPIATVLLKSLYVDNCVTSLDSIEEYEEFRTHATSIMADAKMELRQWERTAVDVPDAKQQLTRVLGLKWDKVQDELFVDIPKVELQLQGKLTKRVILSLVQQIFDPMGYLSPATLVPKLMLQKTWESKKTWDEDLDDTLDIKSEFGEWWRQTSMLAEVKIPRWAFRSELVKSVQFHVFSDASGAAYAAAVFVRVEDQKGVTVQLLQAKARVAPLKKMTIPRLELLGCTIAARLHSSVVEALSMDGVETYFWTDSMTALSWIQRNNEWGTFVGNRVKEICSLTKVENCRHVPGVMNPADLPSRGCNPAQLLKSRWWEGPTWLRGSSETWPSGQAEVNEDEVLKEKKKNMTTVKLVSTSQEAPWYLRRYSSYYMNVRLVDENCQALCQTE
ncbi:DNA-binding protein HEXBP [Folsomia candida]|uniref:DNA-binding protein HEXBP n=1 Tax=Folsomia candida TaxID=158441 RepID=A0A226DGH4_FOLCA|nr:DNA-binding protein HEXBP [Folsomia candida]